MDDGPLDASRLDAHLLPTALVWARAQEAAAGPGLFPAMGECCAQAPGAGTPFIPLGARTRLADLDPHMHCSVIGTCFSTADLRKLLARFVDVAGWSELQIHHEAVRLASLDGEPARALHKGLDKRYDSTLQRFARAKDEATLASLWQDALKAGDVPGAYWALLTHRRATEPLRQQAFGDVHMLSHLVGATNRADIRRLVNLERENADLRDRLDRQQVRQAALLAKRDEALQQQQRLACRASRPPDHPSSAEQQARLQAAEQQIDKLREQAAIQTQRREAAEMSAQAASQEVQRLAQAPAQMKQHAETLAAELSAAESHLRAVAIGAHDEHDGQPSPSPVVASLSGRRLLYVGGRPSSTPAIRALVLNAGGEFRRHDGGIEDRKGVLPAALAWADTVVFPVDCVDHDSALLLKRTCIRHGKPFLVLRSASVTGLIAALSQLPQVSAHTDPSREVPAIRCLRHA